jgi:hypothetical protein
MPDLVRYSAVAKARTTTELKIKICVPTFSGANLLAFAEKLASILCPRSPIFVHRAHRVAVGVDSLDGAHDLA